MITFDRRDFEEALVRAYADNIPLCASLEIIIRRRLTDEEWDKAKESLKAMRDGWVCMAEASRKLLRKAAE